MTTTDSVSQLILDTKTKLIDKLSGSGWDEILRLFLNSSDFEQIIQKLHTEVSVYDRRFTPGLKHIFKAFQECPWNKTKVVIIGQDPYFTPAVADGIAFSCGLTMKAQPSLKYMFNAIDPNVEHDPDLTRWANQGVLLLNSALTVQINKPGTHYDIWKDFMVYLIDQICAKKEDVIFVLMGKQADTFKAYIKEPFMGKGDHPVISVSHPASAAYQKAREWNGGHVFNDINKWLISKNMSPIKW